MFRSHRGISAWTNYGTGNVNSSEVRDIIGGTLVINKTLDFGEYIGQHNNGYHTTLYDSGKPWTRSQASIRAYSDTKIPVPVVDAQGRFLGWAMFHVVSASGGSSKEVVGYFESDFNDSRLTVGDCTPSPCTGTPGQLAKFVLKLID